MKYDIIKYGHEQEPIAVIDDFSSSFETLYAGAVQANFRKAGAAYPGIRAALDPRYLSERSAILSEIVQKIFSFKQGLHCDSCDYSIVTLRPEQLSPAQSIPHYDASDSRLLAFMHYMLGADRGGTAFYRHKATGFEAITTERQAEYKLILSEEGKNMNLLSKDYIYGDNDQFEMIGEIESRPNRLILYRGRILHSGVIPKNMLFSSDPHAARLTINGFLSDKS